MLHSLLPIASYIVGGGGHYGWGVGVYVLQILGGHWNILYSVIAPYVSAFQTLSKPAILIASLYLGYVGRNRSILKLLLLQILLTYILSPGLASQYLFWAIPLGALFFDTYFAAFSIMMAIWSLNFYQHLVFSSRFLANYGAFVPIVLLGWLNNFALYPKALSYFLHFLLGVLGFTIVICLWLRRIWLSEKLTDGGESFSVMRLFRWVRGNDLEASGLTTATSVRGPLMAAVVLCTVILVLLGSTGVLFYGVDRKAGPYYPQSIKFQGNKIEQYLAFGRTESWERTVHLTGDSQFIIQPRTTEAYKLYVNGEYAVFNWAPGYRKEFGTNRAYKDDFPWIDLEPYKADGDVTIRIVANFTIEEPERNYISYTIKDTAGNVVIQERKIFAAEEPKPFCFSIPFVLSLISLSYWFVCRGVHFNRS